MTAPSSSDLAGLLLYASTGNSNTMHFNGFAESYMTGTIAMPAAPLVYNDTGNLHPSNVKIIGYTVELTRSNHTHVLYRDADHSDSNMPARIGLMQSS